MSLVINETGVFVNGKKQHMQLDITQLYEWKNKELIELQLIISQILKDRNKK